MPRGWNYRYACEHCKEVVQRYVRPYRVETFGPPKYCSNECRAVALAGQLRERRKKQKIVCEVCEAAFEVSGSRKGRKYCSAECQQLSMVSPDGTRRADDLLYWFVKVTGHPYARCGGHWILEHRLVTEKRLQRDDPGSEFLLNGYLHPGCHVHHKDSSRWNNEEENLEPMWPADHHGLQKGQWRNSLNTDTERQCWLCRKVKPHSEYTKCRANSDGIDRKCRTCNKIYLRWQRGKLDGSEDPEVVQILQGREKK